MNSSTLTNHVPRARPHPSRVTLTALSVTADRPHTVSLHDKRSCQHSVDRCSSVRLTCTSFCLLSTSRAFSRKMYPNAAWSR